VIQGSDEEESQVQALRTHQSVFTQWFVICVT
jgi:hypothetical protein